MLPYHRYFERSPTTEESVSFDLRTLGWQGWVVVVVVMADDNDDGRDDDDDNDNDNDDDNNEGNQVRMGNSREREKENPGQQKEREICDGMGMAGLGSLFYIQFTTAAWR